MEIKIQYEDAELIAAEKPCGMPAQADKTGDLDLLTALEEQTGFSLKPVHRLDRPVGGMILLAKTTEAASRLSACMQEGILNKYYLAVLCGSLSPKKGTWTDFLWKNARTNLSEVVAKEKKGAKKAVLHYEVLGEKEDLSLVKIALETGRHHQIRVQTAFHGAPIWGDRKYNGKTVWKKNAEIALWSYAIEGKIKDGAAFSVKAVPNQVPFSYFSEYLAEI